MRRSAVCCPRGPRASAERQRRRVTRSRSVIRSDSRCAVPSSTMSPSSPSRDGDVGCSSGEAQKEDAKWPSLRLWHRLLRAPGAAVSESGRLRRGDGAGGQCVSETVRKTLSGRQTRSWIQLKQLSPRLSLTARNATLLAATWRYGDGVPSISQLAKKASDAVG